MSNKLNVVCVLMKHLTLLVQISSVLFSSAEIKEVLSAEFLICCFFFTFLWFLLWEGLFVCYAVSFHNFHSNP